MSTSLLHRVLSDPSAHEVDLQSFDENKIPESDNTTQSSFYNLIEGDLETRVVKVSKNTNQKIIVVTQDKAILCLKRNIAQLGRKDWVAPLSLVLSILISLSTADFKDALYLQASEWKAMFVVAGFIATGWLATTLHKAMTSKNFHEVIRDIVLEIGARKPAMEQ